MGKVKSGKKPKSAKDQKSCEEGTSGAANESVKKPSKTPAQSSDSNYAYKDFLSATTALRNKFKKDQRIRKLEKTTSLKKRHFLSLAISKITGKPIHGENPKVKKISSQVYSVGKASTEAILRQCKSYSEKITCKRSAATANFRDVSFAMCHFLLQHEWSDAVKCLYHMLRNARLKGIRGGFDDAEMKTLFVLLLNHPERRSELLHTFVPAIVKNCSESDLKDYLSNLLILPEKLAYPYFFNAPEPVDVKSLPALLRSKKEIKYDGSEIETD